MTIDWMLALAIAVEGAGFIQWGKGWLRGAPSWVWALLLPPLCIGFAFAPKVVHVAALGMAFAQLGYENIIQMLAAKVGAKP